VEKSEKKGKNGILIVLLKIFGKIGPKLAKGLKVLFGMKAVGAAASVGLYSFMFTWQMGVALTVFIAWHEYGHLFAMKKCGLKTNGMYLIPGFGAVAIAAEKFRSGKNEAYIALLGPVFGIGFVAIAIATFLFTGQHLYIAIASMMTFINLFNLFPVNPLDGGRVIKSLLYSFRESFGFYFTFVSLALAGFVSLHLGFMLLALVALIGASEVFNDYGLSEVLQDLSHTFYRLVLGTVIALFIIPSIITVAVTPNFWGIVSSSIFGIVAIILLFMDVFVAYRGEEKRHPEKTNRSYFFYPWYVLVEMVLGVKELFSLHSENLHRIDGHIPMTKKETWLYTLLYIALVVLHIAILYYISLLPGMSDAIGLLK